MTVDLAIPDPVRVAFATEGFLTLTGLAGALGWSVKTLRRHCDAGTLAWRQKGLGAKRHHRVIALADFVKFWGNISQGGQCQSTGTAGPHFGGSTSRSLVIDFPGSRTFLAAGPSVKRKRRRAESAGRLLSLSKRLDGNNGSR